ncbi:MAG: hypothetical protein RLT05_24715 [Bauldia litoralis]
MKPIVRYSAFLALVAGVMAAPANAAPPAAPPPAASTDAQSAPALTPVRHLWPQNPVCRRLRLRGWRYGIWEARVAYRRHCRVRRNPNMRGPDMRGPGRGDPRARGPETGQPVGPRFGRRECRRLRTRGWQWGDRQARRQYRRFCLN